MKKTWLKILTIVALTGYVNASLYENAEDGSTNRWRVYDNSPRGAKIRNVYDDNKNSHVISLLGQGKENGFVLGDFSGSSYSWKNSEERVLKWSMRYNEPYYIYIAISTKNGKRYLLYSQRYKDGGKSGKYIYIGLGEKTIDGNWHNIVRDLDADLKRYDSSNRIISVDGFLVRGSGKLDDIALVSSSNEDISNEDSSTNTNEDSSTTSTTTTTDSDEDSSTTSTTTTTDSDEDSSTTSTTTTTDSEETRDIDGTFKHPGVFTTKRQLDFIAKKISNGESPWREAFNRMKGSSLASKSYKARPQRVVTYGSHHRDTRVMEIEAKDALAAYTQALMWSFTKNKIYANNAIKILNGWARTLREHRGDNKGLVSAWSSINFVRAAEIIRYTYSGWSSSDIRRFEEMLKYKYLPNTKNGTVEDPYVNGNWELLMADATISMGIFLNDKSVFNKGIALWRKRVPAYIYLSSDGRHPILVPESQAIQNKNPNWGIESYLWFNQNRRLKNQRYKDGMSQETCRDFGHVALGFAGMVNAAETAYIQGVNLYGEERKRIIAGMEFHTEYINRHNRSRGSRETNIESWLCRNNIDSSGNNYLNIGTVSDKTYEVVYNHYVNRVGVSLPETHDYVFRKRPTDSRGVTSWETLTNADIGNIGR